MSETTKEAQESAPTFFQAIAPVVFHQDIPEFSPIILLRGYKWPALSVRADTAHAYPALTETPSPDLATPAAGRSGKINSIHLLITEVQTATISPPTNLYSDATTVVSIRDTNGDSDYVKLAENSPTSPVNTPNLAGHISELEEMHKVVEGKLDAIAVPTVLFSRIDKLEIPELNDAETKQPENHQDNGATPPVNTQTSLSHLALEDTPMDSAVPLLRPHIEAGNTNFQ